MSVRKRVPNVRERVFTGVRQLYNYAVRPLLPRKWGVVAGVPVKDFRLFDRTDCQPEAVTGYIGAIEEHVSPGDVVVDVASGRGIAAVTAARAGAESVHSYEASDEMVPLARQTVEASRVGDVVAIHHAAVGETHSVYGKMYGASLLEPADLPACDVLQLDCEGAELSILDGLQHLPRVIIVETHPMFGSPAHFCEATLHNMGYDLSLRYYQDGQPDKDVVIAQQ